MSVGYTLPFSTTIIIMYGKAFFFFVPLQIISCIPSGHTTVLNKLSLNLIWQIFTRFSSFYPIRLHLHLHHFNGLCVYFWYPFLELSNHTAEAVLKCVMLVSSHSITNLWYSTWRLVSKTQQSPFRGVMLTHENHSTLLHISRQPELEHNTYLVKPLSSGKVWVKFPKRSLF